MNILQQLEGAKQTLESLHSGGLDLASDIEAVGSAINLISEIHRLVDGQDWSSNSTAELIDNLIMHELVVRSPDDMEIDG